MINARVLLIAGAALSTCLLSNHPVYPASHQTEASRPQEATSFGGVPLYRFDIDGEKLAELQGKIIAIEALEAPTETDFIHLGEHLVSQGRFQDAILAYGRGLELFPQSYKLRRHRGHRYINVRQLEKAIVDLTEAANLLTKEDEDVLQVSSSGTANGTYKHWIYYHIGLYNYLNGNYDQAADAYRVCVSTAVNGNLKVGATDWLYNSLVKAGRLQDAQAAIDAIPADIEANPNASYYKRVMVYKGLKTIDDVIDVSKPKGTWTGGDITTGYGIANVLKGRGEVDLAQQIFDSILASPYWSSWAYVVTDREQNPN